MRFIGCYLRILIAFLVSVIIFGCASSMQQADKLAMSNPEAAVGAYKSVMDSKPGTPEAKRAHLKMADTYYKRMNNPAKGLEVYEEVARAYPGTEYSAEANYAVGMHYFQAKDFEKAKESFIRVTKDVPGTEKAYDSELLIGKCYEELKKFEDAAKIYEEFSKTRTQHRLAAQAGLNAAKIYNDELDDSDKAIEVYKNVAKDYSLSSSGREARSALEEMGVQLTEVAPELQGAETQQETESQTSMNRPDRTRRRATNVPRADIGSRQRTEEQQARTVSPDFGVDPVNIMPNISADGQGTMYDAMFMFANMNLQSQQYKEAGALYEKAIELAGNRPWDNKAHAYFGLAKSYKGIGRDDKARQMFLEAIKLDRKVIDSMIVSGETYYSDEEYEEAIKAYKLALGLVPYKDSEIYYKLGLAYKKLGDTDNELDAFERAVALKPNDREAVQSLAEVLAYRKKDMVRGTIYDTEAKGQGNNDYKVQRELGDLSYKYDSFTWAKIKYGNTARLLSRKIEDDLRKFISASTEPEAKAVVEDITKLTLKAVMDSANAGNKVAIAGIQKVEPLINDFRIVKSRVAISDAMTNQYNPAQQALDELIKDDPGAINSPEYQYALGL
ncbi:tetratricopeptide repeat protein, partial [Candidatus Poribacteria bacterium]|nr:tetratricopeptide repeat protein [Candidatus Poribacteria bacterium]